MRILIRIVFVIFIANGIDCLGKVCDDCCDDCCDCFKDKDENITPESLVNDNWFKVKGNNLILMIFKKENDLFTSTENGDKVSFKLDEKDNSKIAYQDETENKLKLKNEKYALFEIKTKGKNTVYLYCSDVESSEKDDDFNGIFGNMDHISISVIACDTEKVMNMEYMFSGCSSLTKLDLQKFNTTNVTNMEYMFCGCENLKKLEFVVNFNTKNVTNMNGMFKNCRSLKKINFGNNFNTEKVTDMFYRCSKLKELNLESFNTKNVENIDGMFQRCGSLKKINFGNNFNTEKITKKGYMFYLCSNFPEDIRNKLENVEEVIKFFKEKNK